MIDRQEEQISWFINNKFQCSLALPHEFMEEKTYIYIESGNHNNEVRILSKQEIHVKNNEIQL